jgi:CRP-like cAMP-binding protein
MLNLPRPNLEHFLERLMSRSVLTNEEQQAVLSLPGHAAQVQANRDFVALGQRVDHACLIVAGIVGRFDQNGEGARQITAIHIPGEMCDLHSVVQPIPTSALQALSVATILRVPHAAIRAVAGRFPALAEAFWRDCQVDAAILGEWVVNVGRRDAKRRVAHLLCEMTTRLGAADGSDDILYDFPVTLMQIAVATAQTTVHVNRTLQSLRTDGLVDWRTRLLHLPRWKALMEFAEFDRGYLQVDLMPEQRLRIVTVN